MTFYGCVQSLTDANYSPNPYRTMIKGKVVPVLLLTEHHVMKAYWGSGGITSRFLDLGTRWR